jgi:S-phase kinase-associated protein 1
MSKLVTVVCGSSGDNNDSLQVEEELIKMSSVLSPFLVQEGEEQPPIPIPSGEAKATKDLIEKVFKFCSENKSADIDQSDSNIDFFNQCAEEAILFDIIVVSNFLDIKVLTNAASQFVAAQIRGKTPEEIRELFDIKNDFTAEEEETFRQENAWLQ